MMMKNNSLKYQQKYFVPKLAGALDIPSTEPLDANGHKSILMKANIVSHEDPAVRINDSLYHYEKQRQTQSSLLFPSRLRRLLGDAEAENNQHIVSWLPSGKGFKVHDPDAFTAKLLQRYFRQTQFKSFTRQL